MDDGLKQRVVGAVVLLALGILFVPVLFEPEFKRELDRTTQIPPALGLTPLQVADPVRPEVEPAKAAAEMYPLLDEAEPAPVTVKPVKVTEPSKAVLVKKPTPAQRDLLDSKGVPKAWVVQVASFNTQARAKVLRDELLAKNYPAFTRTLQTTKGRVTRVYVGPKILREKALAVKSELDETLKINSLLVKFKP